jgi:hypothetical protein
MQPTARQETVDLADQLVARVSAWITGDPVNPEGEPSPRDPSRMGL